MKRTCVILLCGSICLGPGLAYFKGKNQTTNKKELISQDLKGKGNGARLAQHRLPITTTRTERGDTLSIYAAADDPPAWTIRYGQEFWRQVSDSKVQVNGGVA